jgi:competence protein ComFC
MPKFLKICVDSVKNIFKICFGREDPEFLRALSLDASHWQIIANPQTLADGTLTVFPYENKMVKNGILAVKRRNNKAMAEIFAEIAADFLVEELSEMALINNFQNPIIIGIPVSSKNMKSKGFNHSEEIAKRITKQIPSLEFLPKALIKTRHTEPQKNLQRSKRLTNLKHSMIVAKNHIKKISGRCIIVVDDVTTTGATLSEAKRALLSSGARKVLLFALAH